MEYSCWRQLASLVTYYYVPRFALINIMHGARRTACAHVFLVNLLTSACTCAPGKYIGTSERHGVETEGGDGHNGDGPSAPSERPAGELELHALTFSRDATAPSYLVQCFEVLDAFFSRGHDELDTALM